MGEPDTLESYLKRLCRIRGLTWRQASLRAGLNPDYLSHYFTQSGEHRWEPKAETLRQLAEALGGDYEYMLYLRGLGPPQNERDALTRRLVAAIRRLSPQTQETLLTLLEGGLEVPEAAPEAAAPPETAKPQSE